MPPKLELPVDAVLGELLGQLAGHRSLVLEAPAGAGKTTRVPPALLEFGPVMVLEPRRIAARMASRWVAAERGEAVGETVGYQVRFEEATGPRTRLRFLTEGVLTRRMMTDPELDGVSTVVLDEFHERHLEGDVALALLRRLQRRRPELRVVVMSATLDGARVARHLDNCPVIRAEGRLHPVSVEYTPHSPSPLEEQVRSALESLLAAGLDGDVLVFLPGAAEIRRSMRSCQPAAARAGLELLPLHGDLPHAEQDRAVTPGPVRKVILSTNVAESSLTIPGVSAVIDSGLARLARDSPWTGLPSVEITRISKASADQRAGRAGRTRPGRVIRLYPREDYARRPERETADIARRELSGLLLELRAMGVRAVEELDWFEAPPAGALRAAVELLERLGALEPGGGLTPSGRAMARLSLHPRLAALVVEAGRLGAGREGALAAAVLSAGDRLDPQRRHPSGPSDVLALMEGPASPLAGKIASQIRRLARPQGGGAGDEALLRAILRAFPDRVARRRAGKELLLAGGGSAVLADTSVVTEAGFLVAVDIESRRERGLPLVRLASAIEPGWLIELFPERVTERSGVEWRREAQRVEASSAWLYDGLVVEESRGGKPDARQAASMLAERALEAGLERFADADRLAAFLARLEFASHHGPVPSMGDAEVRAGLESLCEGLASFAELQAAASGGGLLQTLRDRLTPRQARLLDELAPERIRLHKGRSAPVRYERGKTPWLASRLQDFFGMRETPRLAGGKVAVVLHLLAPNQRPVQTTTDLAGFWQRLYPELRRQLRRRYPKHAWPEDPAAG